MLNAIFNGLNENEHIIVYVRNPQGVLLETVTFSSVDKLNDAVKGTNEYSFELVPETNDQLNVRAIQVEIPYGNVYEKAEALRALQNVVVPPSFIVDASLSLQTYWVLTEHINSDTAHEITTLMRVALNAPVLKTRHIIPGSRIAKVQKDVKANLVRDRADLTFTHDDIRVLLHLSDDIKHAINTASEGNNVEAQGWKVSLELHNTGVSNAGIKTLFAEKAVGGRSVKNLLNRPTGDGSSIKLAHIYAEKGDCYFVNKRGGSEIVSTFVFEPLLLLEGAAEDTFIGNIRSQGEVWKGVRLPKSAFQSVSTLSKKLSRAAWAWLGTDKDVRFLLPHITAQWQILGAEKSLATDVIGRHGNYWVTPDTVLSEDKTLNMFEAGILYIDTGRTKPDVTMSYIPGDDELIDLLTPLAKHIPNLNTPFVVWAMLGWFMATPFKTLLKALRVPFPHLAIYGSTGAGKTSTVESIFLPLLGYREPAHSHDCDTTSFALMALMSSTNTVPISLAEFRQSLLGVASFKALRRMLLLAYDSAEDVRGTREQYTIEYKFQAPIVLSGEDVVSDKAIRRRAIIVSMNPLSVRDSTHQKAFVEITKLPLGLFAPKYIQYTLAQRLTDVDAMFSTCCDEIDKNMSNIADERVRRNCAVVLLGTKFFQSFLKNYGVNIHIPNASFLGPSLSEIQNVALQRGYLMADEFIVDIINEVSNATDEFPYRVTNEGKILWVQLRQAYDWWRKFRLQRHDEVFTYKSISSELRLLRREATNPNSYILTPRNMSISGTTYYVFGFDIEKCFEAGFDVPDTLNVKQVIVKLRK